MSTLTRLLPNATAARFFAHLRTPLYRNGYALVFSSAATSGLGMVYWILAARLYNTEAIGLNSALISAMIFLANISQLNLMNALNRFLPNAGRAAGRMVGAAYVISAVMAVLSSLIFIAGLNVWSPTLNFLGASAGQAAGFVIATVLWCLFVLQDSALAGLRQATWVPVENLLFALAKIALLVALAGAAPLFGVFASWTMAVALALLPTNLLIFRWLIPRHVQAIAGQAETVAPGQIARYVAGDYVSSLISLAASNLLPIIVVERAGASANAYFYLSWTIAYTFYLVSRNMGQSLIAEAAADATRLNHYSYRTFVQTARLLVPLVGVVVIAAPFILQLFGRDYATEGALLLQLLCLSALPNMVTSLYTSIARVQRRVAALLWVQTLLAVMVFALSYFLLDAYGIVGVGVAWLVSQSVMAAALLVTELRTMWLSHLNLREMIRWFDGPRQWWWAWAHRGDVARARATLSAILPGVDSPGAGHWIAQRFVQTVSDMTVAMLGPAGRPPVAVLKLPQSPSGAESLRQHTATLTDLHADERLSDWRAFLPHLLARGEIDGQQYIVESVVPGLTLESLLADSTLRAHALAVAAVGIDELHRNTVRTMPVTEAVLARWVDEPLAALRDLNARRLNRRHDQTLTRLGDQLHEALSGRTLAVSWTHGDFAPGNILLTPDGATVTGLVDWELAAPDSLPQLDVLLLLLASRTVTQRRELGDVVRELLVAENWAAHEQVLLEATLAGWPGERIESRALILLCWLRHVAANLTKSTGYAGRWLWVMKNVEGVLDSL